jgi:hypothetical protein
VGSRLDGIAERTRGKDSQRAAGRFLVGPWSRRLAATDLGGNALLRRNSIDCFTPQSSESLGVPREFHRKDAKSAKSGDELAHNPLTFRLMPCLIGGTFQFTPQPAGPAPMHGAP